MTDPEREPQQAEATSPEQGLAVATPPQNSGGQKDIWDKLSAVSTFISGVLIALIGGTFTFLWHEAESQRNAEEKQHQSLIGELETFEKFIPYLDGTESKIILGLVGILTLNKQLGTGVVAYFRAYGTPDQKKVASGMLIPKYYLDTWATDGVENGPEKRAPAIFEIAQYNIITDIRNYHWNYGAGSQGKYAGKPGPAGEPPATIGIRRIDGASYGPWPVSFDEKRTAWFAKPNLVLPPGHYEVVDSEPDTWSISKGSGYVGMTIVSGFGLD
jgi:hypothetical protein